MPEGLMDKLVGLLSPSENTEQKEGKKDIWSKLWKIFQEYFLGKTEVTSDATARVKEFHNETEIGLRSSVIGKAMAHLGKRETTQNAGPEIRMFTCGKNEPWCADFVSYVLWEAGVPIASGENGWKVASVAAIREHFTRLGRWTNIKTLGSNSVPDCVKPGDLITWTKDNASGEGTKGHIGIVEKVQDGKVYTIEGNTRGEGSTRPDMVARKEHKITDLINDRGTVGVCTLA